MNPDKKVAFITGGNRGIGFETAKALAEKGIHVIIGSRTKAKGEEAVKLLTAKNLKVSFLVFDVTKPDDHQYAYDQIQTQYGKLDILINNAGVWLDPASVSGNDASAVSLKVLKDTFDTNFFSVVTLTQTLLPLIKKSGAGRIVNLSSILASLSLHSDPGSSIYDSKYLAYNSSKAALNTFTIHLAHELKNTNIKVNSAHPGWVRTQMGGENAPLDVSVGCKTSVELALLPASGPSGGFFHQGDKIPW